MTAWRFDPVGAAAIAIAGLAYALGLLRMRRAGEHWPARRAVGFFVLGLGSFALVEFGFLGVYSSELRWAFSTRIALLLFVVPALLATGRPWELAERTLRGRSLRAFTAFSGSRLARILGNVAVGTIVALVVFSAFLTPIAGYARTTPLLELGAGVFIPLLGSAIVLPLAGMTLAVTSLALAAEFLLAFVELVLDAIPGIVLRLSEPILDGVPALVTAPAWFPSPARDQQLSGDLLWFIAEVADIPVLIFLFVRWARHDRREAHNLDALTDEEMAELTRAHLRNRSDP